MAVLTRALAALALLSGCYSPELRDCTVSCAAPSDCAGGQVCGRDGYCTAEGETGRCTSPVDAGLADAHPDATVHGIQVPLHVMIMGKGRVDVAGVGSCDSDDDEQHGNCMWDVPAGAPLTLEAVVTNSSHPFMTWTMPPSCVGATPSCTVTPLAPTTVSAKFK